MCPIEVNQDDKDTPRIREHTKNIPKSEKEQSSRVEQLAGILKIQDPRIIEERAECDLIWGIQDTSLQCEDNSYDVQKWR